MRITVAQALSKQPISQRDPSGIKIPIIKKATCSICQNICLFAHSLCPRKHINCPDVERSTPNPYSNSRCPVLFRDAVEKSATYRHQSAGGKDVEAENHAAGLADMMERGADDGTMSHEVHLLDLRLCPSEPPDLSYGRASLTKKTIVEVSVADPDGNLVPFGIMNADQAAELSDDYHKTTAHTPIDDEPDVESAHDM